MADASLTRYALSYGAQDTVTGWYQPTYASSTIEGSIQPQGKGIFLPDIGFRTSRYPHTLFTSDCVYAGDEIKDAFDDYFLVKSVVWFTHLNQASHAECELGKRSPKERRPTTSGIWHFDSDALRTDPRYSHKLWLGTYLTADNMELDNGATDADVDTLFSGGDLFLDKVLLTNDVDGVMSIDKRSAQQLTTYNHYPYAFLETVPITCYAVDKAGLTATNLLEQMEQEIRHVCTDHPLGSIRSVDSTEYKSTDIGGTRLWETIVTIWYKRANDDYAPTYPRITWGPSAAPTGTYYFPNVLSMVPRGQNKDAWIDTLGFTGSMSQGGGSKALDVDIICDLDVEPSALTWKRPQTTTPKTDATNYDIAIDLWHNEGIDQPYHLLTLQSGGPSFKVRLSDDWYVDDDNQLHLHFKEYRTTTGSALTYKERLGIT